MGTVKKSTLYVDSTLWNIQRKLQPQFLIISENISEVTALKKFFLQFLELSVVDEKDVDFLSVFFRI